MIRQCRLDDDGGDDSDSVWSVFSLCSAIIYRFLPLQCASISCCKYGTVHSLPPSSRFSQDDLDLDMSHIDALSTGDLSTREGISRCTNACKALHKCLNTDLHPGQSVYWSAGQSGIPRPASPYSPSCTLGCHTATRFMHECLSLIDAGGRVVVSVDEYEDRFFCLW